MAFLIPDNLKARRDAPNAVRHVAGAFQIGLDENAVVWFEPPFDPTGEKPHLVVLLPDRGVAVLEVLDVRVEKLLGVLRGRVRLLRDGREVEVENPLSRAQDLAATLRIRIESEHRLASAGVRVGAGAVLPYVTAQEFTARGLERVIQRDRCLLREEIDGAIAGIGGEAGLLRIFAKILGGAPATRITEELDKVLRGVIHPDVVIDRVAGAAPNGAVQLVMFRPPTDGEDEIRVMDRQQEAMAKSLGEGHRVIRGVAGSGKTLVLIYRARLLARIMPTHRFLLTCYTRTLAGQLRALLAEHPNVEVTHLDQLMAKVIRAAGLQHPGYRDDDGEAVVQMALGALPQVSQLRYRAVLVDEAQDFSTDALKFALGLLHEDCDDLVIVADAAQNIFRRRSSWRQAGIQAQGRTRILRTNYRNTRQILEFASRFLFASGVPGSDAIPDPEDENTIIPPESSIRAGPPPRVELTESPDAEVAAAAAAGLQFAERAAAPRQVAVLYSGSMSRGIAERLHQLLAAAGEVFWLTDPNDRRARDHLAETEAQIILSTVESSKGLEFPFVILCGLSPRPDETEDQRRLAYVGMTRATQELAVFATRGSRLAADLEAATQSSS